MGVITRTLFTVMMLMLLAALCAAQQPDLGPNRDTAAVPTVTFTLSRPGGEPDFLSVAVLSTGPATYLSTGRVVDNGTLGERYELRFIASAPIRERIFDLARRVNYFQGDFEYRKNRIANTGAKTLAFAQGQTRHQTTYNWSENAAIQQLTEIFQNISTTVESGRRLEYLHRHDKLGLNEELKRMEEWSKSGRLAELQAIEPVLRRIATDTAVMRLARNRASQLLARLETAAHQPSR